MGTTIKNMTWYHWLSTLRSWYPVNTINYDSTLYVNTMADNIIHTMADDTTVNTVALRLR